MVFCGDEMHREPDQRDANPSGHATDDFRVRAAEYPAQVVAGVITEYADRFNAENPAGM